MKSATSTEPDTLPKGFAGWFAGLGRWHRLFLAFAAGALMTAGHPPIGLPWVMFVALPLLVMLVAHAPTGRAAAWIGWGAGFGYFTTGLHWIGHAFLVDPDRFAWLMPLGVLFLPAGLALFWMLGFWAARRLWPRSILAAAGILAIAWTLVEFARGHVLTGFPWALPGYVWVDTPAMQAAAVVGPYGLTALTLWLCALPGVALMGRSRWVAGAAIAAGAGIWLAGELRLPDIAQWSDDSPTLRLVQPNAPQHLKWKSGYYEAFYQRALDSTSAPPTGDMGPVDIVIWPESVINLIPEDQPEVVAQISEAAGDAVVLAGVTHGARGTERMHWTNAFLPILPDGALGVRYDKHHLVPFGEYLPFEGVLSALGLRQFAIQGGFHRGVGPRTIKIDGVPSYSALICYEAIFPHEVVGDERPEWLVQPTNDAWFGSYAGPQQHYAQAKFRAVEQGLPLVRAANTGISAVVDAYGREVVSIKMHNYSYIDTKLPNALLPTPYSRLKSVALLLVIAIIAISCVIMSKMRS
ncbi:MAG: apolipoprotein N-acyltransferase [Pseudomonadota bacterium]